MEFQCRGDCPASLHLLLFVCGKHSAPSRTPFRQATKTVRLPTGIGVHLQTGMLFGITTESCSASERNRVHFRPDSPPKIAFLDWDGSESEGAYNLRCSGKTSLLNFDVKNIRYGGGQSQFEFCDLLHPKTRTLIFA